MSINAKDCEAYGYRKKIFLREVSVWDVVNNVGRTYHIYSPDPRLSERAKEISAFATPYGLYQYKVMPFGMKNAPATFQRLINRLIADIDGCEAYIDDVIIYSNTWETHLEIMRKFLQRLREASLTINLIGCGHVTYLGHIVGQGKVKPISAEIEAISAFPQPSTKKQVMRFLGMAGYYRKFCPNFSTVTQPLTELLRKNVKFIWTERCQSAFNRLKALLQSAPVLYLGYLWLLRGLCEMEEY